MKSQLLGTLVVVAAMSGSGLAEDSPWLSNYDEAKQAARQKNLPMFVVFR
ncbi:MAG: hypothetical protein O3A00_06705 [Planctomycetota bacterium]|nr:hypothetical protein [Planctomycetota bacterium]